MDRRDDKRCCRRRSSGHGKHGRPFFTSGVQGRAHMLLHRDDDFFGAGMVTDGSGWCFLWCGTFAPPWVLYGLEGKESAN